MRQIAIASTVLVAFVVAAVVASAQEQVNTSAFGGGVSQVQAIEPDAEQVLSVLKGDRTAGDAMPVEVADAFDEGASFGVNSDLSRLAIGNASHSIFVVPARDHVCVSVTIGQGATLICPSIDHVAEGKVGPGTLGLEGGAVGVYGIVPDGVTSVSLEAGEASGDLPVEDNIYYTVVPAGIAVHTLRYVGPSGEVEFRLYDPHKAFDEQQ